METIKPKLIGIGIEYHVGSGLAEATGQQLADLHFIVEIDKRIVIKRRISAQRVRETAAKNSDEFRDTYQWFHTEATQHAVEYYANKNSLKIDNKELEDQLKDLMQVVLQAVIDHTDDECQVTILSDKRIIRKYNYD